MHLLLQEFFKNKFKVKTLFLVIIIPKKQF
jgi:hypothetical protein